MPEEERRAQQRRQRHPDGAWWNARFELVLLDAPSGRCRSDIALNFTDEQGETFQFIRKSESYDENGEPPVRCAFTPF